MPRPQAEIFLMFDDLSKGVRTSLVSFFRIGRGTASVFGSTDANAGITCIALPLGEMSWQIVVPRNCNFSWHSFYDNEEKALVLQVDCSR
jgi:hypothetical protein